MGNQIEIVAEEDYERLDVFLAEELDLSRTKVKKMIVLHEIKNLSSEEKNLKASSSVQAGEKFSVSLRESENVTYLKADPVDFEVIYEDPYILVINKPAGLVIHPSPGNWRNTLVNGLVYRYPEMKELSAWLRPGIVHRLDSGTSGLLVVARTEKATLELQRMFHDREIDKNYIALAHGKPKRSEATISGPIDRDPQQFLKMAIVAGGKPSLTGYKILWTKNNISLVEFKLYTGRTHQIRVHFSALGCPLVGDNQYGAPQEEANALGRVMLHSWRLSFKHPETGEPMSFRQNIPECFINFIKTLQD
ncbi:MAG: RluA family pseudouridine synthase [Synergistaceae bacterium]|nr:RluA family pseudouridine synthase [Synergistaceae bacterium]